MSSTLVIVNPIAGRGAGARLSPQIAGWLRKEGLDFELVSTEAPGHATALARGAVRRGSRTVVAVGGDGTANEVLNGLLQADADPQTTALGILPIGTGNDYAFSAGVPLDLREACAKVTQAGLSGDTGGRILDAGRVQADDADPLYFGSSVGIGFDAIVNIESRKVKRLRGFPVYLVAVLKTLLMYYHAPQTTIRIDDRQIEQPALMISIMNSTRVGGGFYVTPDALMDDGLFDLCIAPQLTRPQMMAFVPRFMRGTHITDPRITMSRGRHIVVTSATPWAAHVDGEIYGLGASRFEVELLPRSLRLLC